MIIMSRRDIRETAVKLLYNFSITHNLCMPCTPEDNELYGTSKLDSDELKYLEEIISRFNNNQERIDKIISENSLGWKLNRISKVDLSILRLAVCEIKYEGTPYKVAVNEAVDIAKEYSGEKSHKFINGVLAGLLNEQKKTKTASAK